MRELLGDMTYMGFTQLAGGISRYHFNNNQNGEDVYVLWRNVETIDATPFQLNQFIMIVE